MQPATAGPDLVLAGSARSGTSSLAAQLGAHPQIDAGKIKESNYFSRHLERGPDWYESLYTERRAGVVRLDASTSYTSPKYPHALAALTNAAPDALVIYAVRQPIDRAISHYLLRRHYFQIEEAETFGMAVSQSRFYTETGDYSRWLPELRNTLTAGRLLVVPFEVITSNPNEVTAQVCQQLGLAPPPDAEQQGRRHRNDVVRYRNRAARDLARLLRRSPAYPWLRSTLGPGRTRKLRGIITRDAELPSPAEVLASCDEAQRALLRELVDRAGAAVSEHLASQDARLDLSWGRQSFCFQDVNR
ncbi:hypothetical protein BH20ACT6_BH20ACT6_07280 [soil metagenome]